VPSTAFCKDSLPASSTVAEASGIPGFGREA
jgi:hypothetical protein